MVKTYKVQVTKTLTGKTLPIDNRSETDPETKVYKV